MNDCQPLLLEILYNFHVPIPWIIFKKSKIKISEKQILSKIKEREKAKKSGNYNLADKIRNELSKEGIDIKDIKDKTIWNYK